MLFVYRGRARAFPAYSGRFFANLHRDLGYIALLMVAVHIAILVHAEPLLLEHLQPTAPLHMSSGLLASILILILVASSIPRLRRKLWRDYHLFRHIHAMFAVSALVLAVVHVVYSGFYLNSPWKLGLALLVALVVPAIYGCSQKQPAPVSASRARDSVRHSHLITYGSAIAAALICLLPAFVSSVA